MTIPSSNIGADDIYREYYKTHTTQQVDINVMALLFGLPVGEIEYNDFAGRSVTEVSWLNAADPDSVLFTGAGVRSGSSGPPWEWLGTPSFNGYPNTNLSLNVIGYISSVNLFGGSAGANGTISLDYTTNYPFGWTVIDSDSAFAGSGSTVSLFAGPTTKNITVTSTNVSNIRFRVVMNLVGDVDANFNGGNIYIELDPISIVGTLNTVRADTTRDRFVIGPIQFHDSVLGWDAFAGFS